MAPLRQSLFTTLLVFFCVFFPVLDAADLSQRREPQGPLGIRLDYALATRVTGGEDDDHQWAFSTHLTFKNPVTEITNEQLRKLAVDAYKEMEVDILQYLSKRKGGRLTPGVMTIMAFGNEVILSSSQKGSTTFINEVANEIDPDSPDPENPVLRKIPVYEKLELCNMFWKDFVVAPGTDLDTVDHRNNRKCGEVMTFHQYYQVHDQDIAKIDPKARMTTVAKRKGEINIMAPCGTNDPDKWGCDFLLSELFGEDAIVTYLGEDTGSQDYDLAQLAGGVTAIDQIEACAQVNT